MNEQYIPPNSARAESPDAMSRNNPSCLFLSIFSFLEKNRFAFLFGSLLLTIGGSEVIAGINMSWGLNVLITLNLLVLLSVLNRKGYLWASVVLIALSLISWCLSAVYDKSFFIQAGQTSAVALLIIGTLSCFHDAFRSGPVDKERIFASLSLYLMFGLIFALLFSLVDKFLPGSFKFPALIDGSGDKPLSQLVYFSFITLATLGYGDIVPLSGPARGLAILEAVIGQIYMVLVVARLVSLYVKSESEN